MGPSPQEDADEPYNTPMVPRFIVLLAAAALLIGCQGGLTQASLAGKYKGEMVAAEPSKADENNPAKALADSFGQGMASNMTLELKADGTFTMTALFLPVAGKWSLEGDTVTLKPEKLTSSGDNPSLTLGDNKPVILKATEGGKLLEPVEQSTSEPQFRFKRE